jgi:Flp pilus assembly protein TadD
LVKLVAAKRHTDATNCVDCHMPKRRTEDVIHVVMTDHYIQRKPRGNLLAPLKEREETGDRDYRGPVVLYYPPKLPPTPESELYVALAQVKQLTNLKEGIASLAAALDKHRPEEGQFYFELAEAYASVGKAKEALRMYEESVRRKPDFRPALLGLSRTLSKSGDHARAEQLLVNTLKSAPRDPAILNDLGLVHLRRGNLTDAVAAFRRAVESDPDYADAYNNLGGVLSQTGDKTGAKEAYRRAIRWQPDFSGAHRNLANLLAERGDIRQAEHHFRKAIYHQPGDALAHFDFATALAASERYEQARAEFEAAVRIDPKLTEAHVGLADMLAMQGNVARSIPHYQQALAMDPDSGPAHLGLGSALATQARRSEALPHLQRAARSSDPAIRQAAEEALKTMR